jgi:hypothetical protein
MVAWQPVTRALGNTPDIWFWVAVVISVFYLGFLCFTIFGVKENRTYQDDEPKITLGDMARAILKNDQLMWTMLSMALFMVGYTATVGFAVDYIKYVFGNEGMYVILVGVCGVAQLTTLAIYPMVAKHFTRKQLYTGATILVLAGYLIFFIAEISIVLIALGAVLVFVGQAAIQLLMLMFLSDTVEYGQWKLGKRSESVTFSIQPLVNKIGGAISTALVSLTLVASGIKVGDTSADSGEACVGVMAGRLASIPVHRNLGRVKDGALAPTEMYIGTKEAGGAMSDVAELHERGYITPRRYVGAAGYYFSDDRLACKVTDDYAHIAHRRVIDKAYRIAYDTLLQFMLDEIEVNEDGTMQAAVIKSWQQSVENAINRSMTAAGELSAEGGEGCECYIDEKQNVLSTSRVEVTLRVRPYAYARYIDVNLGFQVNG